MTFGTQVALALYMMMTGAAGFDGDLARGSVYLLLQLVGIWWLAAVLNKRFGR